MFLILFIGRFFVVYHVASHLISFCYETSFKKEKPPNLDGYAKKSEDAEAWILGMNKFFELHEYTDNMKAIIVIFNLKVKTNIWWEDVKWVKGIRIDDLSWRVH